MRSLLRVFPLVLLLTACRAGGPVHVHTYWGATIERPTAGSTFDWWPHAEPPPAGEIADTRLLQLIRDTVEAELAAMGFLKASSGEKPDVFISMHTGRGFTTSPQGPEDRATLAVQVLDAGDGHLIYLGWADAVVDPTLIPEERKARVEHAVVKILAVQRKVAIQTRADSMEVDAAS